MKTIFKVFVPILIMIGLLALVDSELMRTSVFIIIIAFSFLILKIKKSELFLFIFGVVTMSVSEFIFVSTGVEKFTQNSFLGVMPVWLPILWGYAFVAMSRGIKEFENYFK